MCITEVAFGDLGSGPEFGPQIVFKSPLDETLKQIDTEAAPNRMHKRLEAAIGAKQEAIVMQNKYYQKMMELRTETENLRKHINNKLVPLPSITQCNLPPPEEIHLLQIAVGNNFSSTTASKSPPPPPPGMFKKVGSGHVPPPPPPPPPFLNHGKKNEVVADKKNVGPPGPPPPPAFFQSSPELPSFLKKKVLKTADVPMKKIPWNSNIIKPSVLNKDSLWAEINDSDITFDEVFELLEEKFSTANKKTAACAEKTVKTQTKTKKSVVIQDQKILQALAILQGSCKLSFQEWHRAIMQIDESVLSAGLVDQLRAVLPPFDILKQLKECTEEELQNMVEGEQFVATLASIHALPIRLESIQLKLCWSDNIAELKSAISTVAEACDEVRHSKGLKYFINLVLLAGNFMGRTKTSKDTFAFELSVLNKLVDTKDLQNVETLLHTLIVLLEKQSKRKYVNFPSEDFHHIAKASRVDLNEISKTKGMLKNSLNKISMHLTKYTKQSESDKFQEKMEPFVEQAKKELNVLEGMWENMQLKWAVLQKYLCFDEKKYSMDKLFGDLKLFKEQYENTLREIIKNREKLDSAAKKKKRQPLKSLQQQQPGNTLFNDINSKLAFENTLSKMGKIQTNNEQFSSGVIDKIEQMLEEGKYRPGGTRTPRRNAAKKGQLNTRSFPIPIEKKNEENEENIYNNTIGYRVRRKGQPTVYILGKGDGTIGQSSTNNDSFQPKNINTNNILNSANNAVDNKMPSTEELLQRLKGL